MELTYFFYIKNEIHIIIIILHGGQAKTIPKNPNNRVPREQQNPLEQIRSWWAASPGQRVELTSRPTPTPTPNALSSACLLLLTGR